MPSNTTKKRICWMFMQLCWLRKFQHENKKNWKTEGKGVEIFFLSRGLNEASFNQLIAVENCGEWMYWEEMMELGRRFENKPHFISYFGRLNNFRYSNMIKYVWWSQKLVIMCNKLVSTWLCWTFPKLTTCAPYFG